MIEAFQPTCISVPSKILRGDNCLPPLLPWYPTKAGWLIHKDLGAPAAGKVRFKVHGGSGHLRKLRHRSGRRRGGGRTARSGSSNSLHESFLYNLLRSIMMLRVIKLPVPTQENNSEFYSTRDSRDRVSRLIPSHIHSVRVRGPDLTKAW